MLRKALEIIGVVAGVFFMFVMGMLVAFGVLSFVMEIFTVVAGAPGVSFSMFICGLALLLIWRMDNDD